MKTFVFIGSDNIGDAFLTYQVIDAMTSSIPSFVVHLYHKNHFHTKPLFESHPNVERLGTIKTKLRPSSLFASLKALYRDISLMLKKDDVYISSLLGSGTIYLLLQPLLMWNRLFGRNKIIIFAMKPLLNGKISKHILNFHYEMLSERFGVTVSKQGNYPLLNPDTVEPSTVGIVAGASGIWKCWQPEKFAFVIKQLLDQGFEVKLLGGKSKVDIDQSEAIMRFFPAEKRVKNLVGKTSLFGYFEEIQKACYTITNDSSAQHIANAGNTPCTVLWGRHPKDRVVRAYSYANTNILNIFNEPYQVTPFVKWVIFLTGDCPERSKKCIALNYLTMSPEFVWAKIQKHMESLSVLPFSSQELS